MIAVALSPVKRRPLRWRLSRRAHVAPAKAKSARKATPVKKAPKGRTKPEVAKPTVARDGSKTAKILAVGQAKPTYQLVCDSL
jgi:hypothetical protein